IAKNKDCLWREIWIMEKMALQFRNRTRAKHARHHGGNRGQVCRLKRRDGRIAPSGRRWHLHEIDNIIHHLTRPLEAPIQEELELRVPVAAVSSECSADPALLHSLESFFDERLRRAFMSGQSPRITYPAVGMEARVGDRLSPCGCKQTRVGVEV